MSLFKGNMGRKKKTISKPNPETTHFTVRIRRRRRGGEKEKREKKKNSFYQITQSESKSNLTPNPRNCASSSPSSPVYLSSLFASLIFLVAVT